MNYNREPTQKAVVAQAVSAWVTSVEDERDEELLEVLVEQGVIEQGEEISFTYLNRSMPSRHDTIHAQLVSEGVLDEGEVVLEPKEKFPEAITIKITEETDIGEGPCPLETYWVVDDTGNVTPN